METLSYEGFTEVVKRTVIKNLGQEYEGWRVEERCVFRINEKLHALNLAPPGDPPTVALPNIYLEEFYAEYEAGKRIIDILDEIGEIVRRMPPETDFSDMVSKDTLVGSVIPIVINRKVNAEYLEILPHREFLDLAVVFRAVLRVEGNSHMGIMITWEMLEDWDMTLDDLERIALANGEKNAGTQCFVLNHITTITNGYMIFGAIQGLYCKEALRRLAGEMKDDMYIVPSSIHEVFVVPCAGYRVEGLRSAAAGAISAGVLAANEFLSENIYRYDRKRDEVAIV